MTDTDIEPLNIREQTIRIDKMIADTRRMIVDHERIQAETDRRRQEIRHGPWVVAFAGVFAGVVVLGTGIVFGAVLVKLAGVMTP